MLFTNKYLLPLSLQLEKMKNENTIFDIEHDVDTDFQASQREITQLRKVSS